MKRLSAWIASLPPEEFLIYLTAEGLMLSLQASLAWSRVPFAVNIRLGSASPSG